MTSPQPPARLADLTTLRVGGPATRFQAADSEAELVAAVLAADRAGEPLLLLGGGSNLLVSDAGFPGTVLAVRTAGWQAEPAAGGATAITVAAGVNWDDFVAWSVAEGLSGVEMLSGIPGSVGATPVQNVGAYGGEVAAAITALRVLDRSTGEVVQLAAADAGFGYRHSRFKADPGRWVVLTVQFRLDISVDSAPIRYAELARTLGVEVGDRAPTRAVREAVLGLRRSKGMVIDLRDHDTWSAGSFFTNPVVAREVAEGLPEGAPRFPQADGRVKLSAAWLIDRSGFPRGYCLTPGAPAALSAKHTLALTNRGGATAEDLLALARHIRAGVAARFGVVLVNEPVLVGCEL